jgi:putative membrane protein
MKLIFRFLITAVLVMLIAHFMGGVEVKNFGVSLFVALVLGLLNVFVKPILVMLTFPVSVFTLGLFLFVINALIILLCSYLVDGFEVSSFLTALLFSVVLSLLQSIMSGLIKD